MRHLQRIIEAGSRRIDLRQPLARVSLALTTLAALASLGAVLWIALLDYRAETDSAIDLRRVYVRNVEQKIQEATEAELAASPRRDLAGSLLLRISIDPNGALISAAVARSSGHAALDQLALRIVRNCAPFEPFPEDMRRITRRVEVHSTFQFR